MVSPTPEVNVGRTMVGQNWREVSFLHWRYPVREVRRLVPDGLEIDTFDGDAWVGLTPFVTTCSVLGRVPIPGPRWFPETNLRTYVKAPDGTDGVWFFSLDVTNLANVAFGTMAVPYKWSRMAVSSRDAVTSYEGQRRGAARSGYRIDVHQMSTIDRPDPLAVFLTGRWHTYVHRGPALLRFDIEHQPWPLFHATATIDHESLTTAAGLRAAADDPVVHYSPGVDVSISAPSIAR